jgi:hypothetical protein
VLTANCSPLYAVKCSKGSPAFLLSQRSVCDKRRHSNAGRYLGAEHMATTEPQVFRYGQQVRITVCPQNHPDHVGQVGTVAQRYKKTAFIRVHIGTGICQATAVELVSVEPPPSLSRPKLGPWVGPASFTEEMQNLNISVRKMDRT